MDSPGLSNLGQARAIARELGVARTRVTREDVYAEMRERGLDHVSKALGAGWGSVFRDKSLWTWDDNAWVPSIRARGRFIRVWTYKGPRT
jgi:hypothetical protein